MKRMALFLLVGSLVFPELARSQQPDTAKQKAVIIGLWQAHSPVVGSWLGDNWRFYKDGGFSYNLSDVLNPILSISGHYYIKDSTLFLKVTQIKELTGARIEAIDPGVDFGSFKLEGGQVTTINQSDSAYSDHALKIAITGGKKMIQIDNDKYYRISANPAAHP